MFLGMEWHWWLAIVIALAVLIPVKIKFMKWWGRWQQDRKWKKRQRGKWGEDE